MKPLDQQLQTTIKSLLLSIQDGAIDFSHRAFHIRAYLNYLDEESIIGYTGSERECLLACTPRLQKLSENIANNKDSVNHDLLFKWQFERAKRYLGGLKFKYATYDTGLKVA